LPSVEDNEAAWTAYDWKDGGHEWSTPWGTAADQWVNTIYPRIFTLLPTTSILEIAPGYGRWTPYLLNNSRRYIGIDISEPLIAHCRRCFGPLSSKPTFIVGDGRHFNGVADETIDLVFSFDSLVHVEIDCLSAYAAEINRVLVSGGHAFLHHSNIGEYRNGDELRVDNPGWRGRSVSAETASDAFRDAGLIPLVHEKIRWTFNDYCDCFSTVAKLAAGRAAPAAAADPAVYYNESFGDEIQRSSQLSLRYTRAIDQ
jgi:hypothetical protein